MTANNTSPGEFFPDLTFAAREISERAARRAQRLNFARSTLIVSGAIAGAGTFTVGGANAFAALGAISFVLAMFIRNRTDDSDVERVAEDAAAVADLSASYCWKFAVGGGPLGRNRDEMSGTQRFALLTGPLLEALDGSAPLGVIPTTRMIDLRAASLEVRKSAYIEERVRALHQTMSKQAQENSTKRNHLGLYAAAFEVLGIAGAIAQVASWVDIDMLGIAGALTASVAFYVEKRAFEVKAQRADALTRDLAMAQSLAHDVVEEEVWERFVSQVEEQFTLNALVRLSLEPSARPGIGSGVLKEPMTPAAFFDAIYKLQQMIRDDTVETSSGKDLEKFGEPDILIGANPGGAIVGGIMYFNKRESDFLPISLRGGMDNEQLQQMTNVALGTKINARQAGHLKILIVDASFKSGNSLKQCIALVRRTIEDNGWVDGEVQEADDKRQTYDLRTAVVAYRADPNRETADCLVPTYFIDTITDEFPYGKV